MTFETVRCYRVLAVDHAEDMLALYRDVLCFESEEPAELEALFGEDVTLPSCEELAAEADKPGFEVIACRTGRAALDEVFTSIEQDDPFAVALIEIHLEDGSGEMAGLALAEKIRAADPDIEIVLLSSRVAVPLKEINNRIQPPEKLLYVQKPFRSPELKQIATSLSSKWDAENRLRELNETLTSKVEARTFELNTANRRLRLDISKRAAVLRELQASEQRYRLLFEKDITGNFAADGDGLILDCNVAFAELFGFKSPQDAHGTDIFELWDSMGAPESLLELVMRHTRLVNHEVVLRRGALNRYLLVNFDSVLNGAGELEEVRGYLFDISEPKRLEEQLRQSQSKRRLKSALGSG